MLERLAHRKLQEIALLLTGHIDAAIYLYSIPLLPGVALHELSHAVMAKLLGVRVRAISLFPQRQRGGAVRLGSVEVMRSDALRSALIGAAPLIAGLSALGLIGNLAFDGSAVMRALSAGKLEAIASSIVATLQAPDALLWFYIVFAIANSMMPSPSDTQAWPPVLGALAVVTALIGALAGDVAYTLAPPIEITLRWLAAALAITAFIDMAVIAVLWMIARVIARATGRRVEY
ncbi:MAG: hypothetical protein RMN25_07235 [Anaerolineae bacterium]|nr:hypothetical protein [Thermoflexales bacterium]MDW8407562.1 hypothetical protein [Anaerolineae bacterium]